MTRIATERMRVNVTVGVVRARRRRTPARVRFSALDGPVQVVIEADHEDDARHLCREMGFAFIGLCDG
jgi:hypothetical protein